MKKLMFIMILGIASISCRQTGHGENDPQYNTSETGPTISEEARSGGEKTSPEATSSDTTYQDGESTTPVPTSKPE